MPADAERVGQALTRARDVVVELVRQGKLEEAAKLTLDAIREALAPLAVSVAELTEDVANLRESVAELMGDVADLREGVSKLTENVNFLVEDTRRLHEEVGRLVRSVSELRESVADLKEMVVRHEGRIKGLRGLLVERNVADSLESWLSRKAPEYRVIKWFRTGADVLIEGRGLLAAVEKTTVPYLEAVDRLKRGVGAIKEAWGREPDLLVIWSDSGVVPPEVAEFAAERGVHIVRGHRQLKELLDRVAKASESEVKKG